jgi:hypothetical protein
MNYLLAILTTALVIGLAAISFGSDSENGSAADQYKSPAVDQYVLPGCPR